MFTFDESAEARKYRFSRIRNLIARQTESSSRNTSHDTRRVHSGLAFFFPSFARRQYRTPRTASPILGRIARRTRARSNLPRGIMTRRTTRSTSDDRPPVRREETRAGLSITSRVNHQRLVDARSLLSLIKFLSRGRQRLSLGSTVAREKKENGRSTNIHRSSYTHHVREID